MELKNQEIPATVEPPVRPTTKALRKVIKECYEWFGHDSGHEDEWSDRLRDATAELDRIEKLHHQPAAVAPTMSKEEIGALVWLEKKHTTGHVAEGSIDELSLFTLRAKLAKMESGS